jgi:hypothetical protein
MRFIIIFLMLGLFSCNTEQALRKSVVGNWVITEAYRDEVQTTMLDGAYLTLELDALKTNLFGTESSSAYTISEEVLKQLNNPAIEYKILEKSQDRLILGTTYDNYEFKFVFQKQH